MGWCPDIPQKRLPFTGQPLRPSACVLHRTIGRWGGDQAVLERGRVPSVHFLVGQDTGQVWQYYDTTTTTAHAAGANGYAVGIEFSGQNSDKEELTDWQILAGGKIIRWFAKEHGLPLDFRTVDQSRVTSWVGFLNHSNVQTTPEYTHYDFVTKASFDRMAGAVAPSPQAKGQDMFLVSNADKKDDCWLVTPAGIVPIPKKEYFDLAASGMPHAEKVGQWVIDQWGQKLGKP